MQEKLLKLRGNPHWSFSSINQFVNICSLQWAFRRIYKLEPEKKNTALIFGTAFHKTAEYIAVDRMNGEYTLNEEAQQVFSDAWYNEWKAADKSDCSESEWKELLSKGRNMISCFNNEWLEDGEVLSVGKVFSVKIPGSDKPLIGEIDMIEKDENGRKILVDWKTASRKWAPGKADKDLQATCFLFAEDPAGIDNASFRYDVVTKTKKPSYTPIPTERSMENYVRLFMLVSVIEKAVAAEAFIPSEQSFFCKSCEYASACRNWHRKQAGLITVPAGRAA